MTSTCALRKSPPSVSTLAWLGLTIRSARQRWRERECAATSFKELLHVTVRGWVFRREKGAVMSYGGLKREQINDVMWVSPHLLTQLLTC